MKYGFTSIIAGEISYFELVTKDNFDHITDHELLDRFYADHNNEWLGILLRRYTLLLFGVCMKYLKNEEEAKDSVQQVFLKAITELHKYKVAYFKSWIYMVAKNHCLMKLRDRQAKPSVTITEHMIIANDDEPGQQQHLEKDQLLDQMTTALGDLSPEQKLCVTLFYLEKQSYYEISRETGFTLMQVKSHIQNGKRNLKIALDQKINKSSR